MVPYGVSGFPETLFVDRDGTRIVGIEHVTAALAMTGIDNALLELSGPELPAMDGSAQPFVFLIECAGAKHLAAPRRACPPPPPLELAADQAMARIRPAQGQGFLAADIGDTPEAGFGPTSHAVALAPEALELARETLRDFGNMSSVTILFVLLSGAACGLVTGGFVAYHDAADWAAGVREAIDLLETTISQDVMRLAMRGPMARATPEGSIL